MDVNIVNAIAIFAILIVATTAIVAMDCNGGRKVRDKNWYDGDVRITPLKKLDYKFIRNYNEDDLYSLYIYIHLTISTEMNYLLLHLTLR